MISKKLIVFLFGTTLLWSCQPLLIKLISKRSVLSQVKTLSHQNQESTIVFMPVVHVGKAAYYNSFQPIVDSLRDQGYQIYVESTAYQEELSEVDKLMYNKKFRKFTGYHTTHASENESLPKEFKMKNYMLQDYAMMGINKSNGDDILDLPKNKLIDKYESEFGEIKLSECDRNTPLNDKYACDSEYKKHLHILTNQYRDEYIVQQLLHKKEKKVVLIYGKQHWYSIYPELLKAGFSLIQGKV